MSDNEEVGTSTKRAHDSDNQVEEENESNDGWVGPLPTDAAPAKKRKGILSTLFYLFNEN